MSLVVLIPALKPAAQLIEVVGALAARPQVSHIIVVNDGSPPEYDEVFRSVAANPKAVVLRHAVNLGKGVGLRTGMNWFLCNAAPDDVLVTADADGQHLPDDIVAVGLKAQENPKDLVLGSRAFSGDVPLRSRFGNDVTRRLFKFLIGRSVSDTQTGLRAIPRSMMPRLLRTKARGYEFELEMLIQAAQAQCGISSVPIQTVYLDDNASSHFNPLMDSMRIYFVFLRFISSSLVASAVDFLIFSAVYVGTKNLGWSMALARVVSGTLNFLLNRQYVFQRRKSGWRTLVGFALQEALLGTLAYFAIRSITRLANWGPYLSKLLVESVLFVCSFAVQRDLIFAKDPIQEEQTEERDD